jgi:hypothetical protein
VLLLEFVTGMLTVVLLVRSEVRRVRRRIRQRKKKKMMMMMMMMMMMGRRRKKREQEMMGFRGLRGRWFQGHGMMWRFSTCLMGSAM